MHARDRDVDTGGNGWPVGTKYPCVMPVSKERPRPAEAPTLGEALRRSRERAGMTRGHLADRTGAAIDQLTRWEEGAEPIDLADFRRLHEATLPPKPPGWEEGHTHDARLFPDERDGSPHDESRREYWDRIDRYNAEVARGGWFSRAHRRA